MRRTLRRPPRRTRIPNASLAIAAVAVAVAGSPSAAQTTPPQNPPGGVTALPKSPPPTGLQAPLPAPSAPLPRADRPVLASPSLGELLGRIPSQPLSLNDVVAIALATNRNLALANAALLRSQGRTQEARAAFNPTLNANLQYLRLNQGNSFNIGGQEITIVNEQQRTIGVQATLPIDISGLLRAATDQAKFLEIAARLDVNRTRNQVVLDVKNAFYDVLRTQALVAVASENLQNSLARLDDAQKKFTAGTVARFDVIRAQTDVLNAQQQEIQARNNVSLNIAALNNAIGIDINTPLQITNAGAVETPPGVAPPTPIPPPQNPAPGTAPGEPNPTAPSPQTPAPQDPPPGDPTSRVANVAFDTLNLGPEYDAVLKEALATRPEVLQADANIASARKGIQIARRSVLPSLGLSWGLNYAPDTAGFTPQTTTWQAVAQISLPLFDGGVARARVRQARADVASAEVSRRQSADLVTLDVRQAYLTLLQSRDRVAVANQALAQAQEAFRLARVRYNAGVSAQAGVSPLLEVSDAQAALTQAASNQVNALYDYNNARARLDRAIGRYSYVSNGQGYSAPPPARLVGRNEKGERR